MQCDFIIVGPVLAFAQTIHMTASFLSPIAAGFLTQNSVSTQILLPFIHQAYSHSKIFYRRLPNIFKRPQSTIT